jgi:hypothetical protein
VFKGQIHHVQAVRRRHIYHVKYGDGDSEDFDAEEYKYAYELRQAVDTGKTLPEDTREQNEHDGHTEGDEDASDDGTFVLWLDGKSKLKQNARKTTRR